MVEMLLEARQGEGLEERDNFKRTALHYAASGGKKNVVAFLLSKGVKVNPRDEDDDTPLMLACDGGHVDVVEMLLEARKGKGLKERDIRGGRALHHSFRRCENQKEMVRFLISRGAQVSSRNDDGITPLMLACGEGDVGLVQMLLEARNGQGLEEVSDDGRTLMHYAASRGKKEVVAFLLSRGVSASSRDNNDLTPIVLACERGSLEVVQLLLEATEGQGLEEVTRDGRTVMHHAVGWRGNSEVVAFLLKSGAPANLKDSRQQTPLMTACRWGPLEAVKMLLKHTEGEGVNDKNSEGRTALHLAVTGYVGLEVRSDLVKALLLAEADSSIPDNEGRTPRQIAQQSHRGAAFEWWDGELERPYVLSRARCLLDVSTTQHTAPAAPVPGYLSARVAGGRAVPRVDVRMETECKAKRKRTQDDEGEDEQEEGAAVRGFVLNGLNEELFRELLLEGFHGFGRDA